MTDCQHIWVSGAMYVDPEDLHTVAEMRAAVGESLPECEACGLVYTLDSE